MVALVTVCTRARPVDVGDRVQTCPPLRPHRHDEQHVGVTFLGHAAPSSKYSAARFRGHCGRERPETLALFDQHCSPGCACPPDADPARILRLPSARGPELHPPLEPADKMSPLLEALGRRRRQRGEGLKAGTSRHLRLSASIRPDLTWRRRPVPTAARGMAARGLALRCVLHVECGAQGRAVMPGCRLHEHRLKRRLRRTTPLFVQFSATPPAMHRFSMPVFAAKCLRTWICTRLERRLHGRRRHPCTALHRGIRRPRGPNFSSARATPGCGSPYSRMVCSAREERDRVGPSSLRRTGPSPGCSSLRLSPNGARPIILYSSMLGTRSPGRA